MYDNSLYVTKSGATDAPVSEEMASAVALLQAAFAAVVVTVCPICENAFEFGQAHWRVSGGGEFYNVAVCRACTDVVYALTAREGYTATFNGVTGWPSPAVAVPA